MHMASSMLTFNPSATPKIFRMGDVIQFYPQIKIDYYASSVLEEPCLRHVIYDIYEFRFRPIARYSHSLHKNCYHYIIEIFSDFKLFCFNWIKPYNSYLKLGQWYKGHGQLRNCGNAAEENENISPLIMNSIYRTGKLTGMYENLLLRDYSNNMEPMAKPLKYSKSSYCYEDVLKGYGYSQNLDEFNKNISQYKERSVIFNSTNEVPNDATVIFFVDILNK